MRERAKWNCILIGMISVTIGCGVFKDLVTQRNLRENVLKSDAKQMFSSGKIRQQDVDFLSFSKDSSGSQYQILLWPRGKFSLNPDSGFSGMAEQVIILGNKSSLGTDLTSFRGSNDLQEYAKTERGKKETSTSKDRNSSRRSTVSWKWILACSLGIIVLLIWLCIKIKNQFTIKNKNYDNAN